MEIPMKVLILKKIVPCCIILGMFFSLMSFVSMINAGAVPNFEDVLVYGEGSDEGKVVITIVGDGYTASEIENGTSTNPSFMESAEKIAKLVTEEYPFTLFRDAGKLNIHAIKVISNVSGTGMNAPNDTYFGVYRSLGGATIYPSVEGRRKLSELIEYYAPETDVKVVMANKPQGGDCALPSEKTSCLSYTSFATHEIGHAMGNLADEDDRSSGRIERPDLSQNGDPETVRWKDFIGINGISMEEYNNYGTWYSPGASCLMSTMHAGRDYCTVCAAALTEVMADATGEPFYGTLYNGVSSLSGLPEKSLNTDTVINVSGGTERILDFAFHGCNKLESLTIPESVKAIGNYAFLKCTGLTEITNYAVIPQNITGNDRFYGVARSNITLYVPKGTKDAYLNAGWTGFQDIKEQSSENAQKPTITKQPSDLIIPVGGNAELMVGASVSKGELSYQWYSADDETTAGGEKIPGAVGAAFNPPADKEGTSYYYCIITNTDTSATENKTAETVSRAAKVTVFIKGEPIKVSRARVNTWSTYGSDKYKADSLFDGSEDTYWHGNWGSGGGSGSTAKQEGLVDFDLGAMKTIRTIEIDKRYLSNGRGPVKSVRVLIHDETGDAFPNGESMSSYTEANVLATEIVSDFAPDGWQNVAGVNIDGLSTSSMPRQTVTLKFEQPIETRYLRLGIICGEINDNGVTSDYVQVSEIRLFGSDVEIEPSELKITDINIKGTSSAGNILTFTVEASGGKKPLKYTAYIVGNGKVYYKQTSSVLDTFNYTLNKAGTYSVYIYAIDRSGEKAAFEKRFTIK